MTRHIVATCTAHAYVPDVPLSQWQTDCGCCSHVGAVGIGWLQNLPPMCSMSSSAQPVQNTAIEGTFHYSD